MSEHLFFDRDISWLYFNERVLLEAASPAVPLIERVRFLSIYSSNLDEFYRVRMPVLMALDNINIAGAGTTAYEQARQIINSQQQQFGAILAQQLISQLFEKNICLVYNNPIPQAIAGQVHDYFFNTLAAFLEVVYVTKAGGFFPANNSLYIVVTLEQDSAEDLLLINIPSNAVSRFYSTTVEGVQYIVFIDDIIKAHLPLLFPKQNITGSYSIKITRDAELDLQDEYEGDIAEKIEKQINKRDFGLATRLLYQPGIPLRSLETIIAAFNLSSASKMQGGNYHNLKDLASFPVSDASLQYAKRMSPAYKFQHNPSSLFDEVLHDDILVHTPYQSYDTILRFFNEAAINSGVEEVYTTMYRVASDSRIVHALISAARNGKTVTVFVELKARFDEANNIKWAKRMKEAGVKIIYSIPELKVHSKVALVKKKQNGRMVYLGLLATGNLNEGTARFYTDHILLTANRDTLRELEMVFIFLGKRRKADENNAIHFNHLLVSQFNLQEKFLSLVDNEIANAKQGLSAGITIKLNNLEERKLISKLYEASNAGVKINLIVRSICCLIPGVAGMSENITIKRIVDRYLEHGRVFIFNNNNDALVFMGSSDWMNRNIYRRVEVCFPIYDKRLKEEMKQIIALQLQDDSAAVMLNSDLQNVAIENKTAGSRSQDAIYSYCLRQAGLQQSQTK